MKIGKIFLGGFGIIALATLIGSPIQLDKSTAVNKADVISINPDSKFEVTQCAFSMKLGSENTEGNGANDWGFSELVTKDVFCSSTALDLSTAALKCAESLNPELGETELFHVKCVAEKGNCNCMQHFGGSFVNDIVISADVGLD